MKNINFVPKSVQRIPGVQLAGGGGEASPALFWKSKKYPDFGKKGPDCVHPWGKFTIQNVVLRVSRRKNSEIFPVGPFFLKFLTTCLSKSPNFTKPPLHWIISGWVPEFYHHIKIWEKYNEQKVFFKKTVLNSFAIFTEKYLCCCFFFNKNAGLQAWNFIKERLERRCFLLNITKRLLLRAFSFMSVWTFFLYEQIHRMLHRMRRRRFLKNKTKYHSKT